MMNEWITVNSRAFDGSIRRSWQCRLAEQTDSLLVLMGEFDADVSHDDLGLIERGTVTREYFWLERWYNIFCFYEPDGVFRNYYCNICMPPTFENGVLDYVDLDLDVVVWPDGRVDVLDEADYQRNSVKYDYPESVREHISSAIEELLSMASNDEFPSD